MIKAIVTDIEGTTSSLSFVKDVLFPYARAHLRAFVNTHRDDAAVRRLLDDARAVAGGNVPDEAVTEQLLRWIDEDKKVTPLKALQGMIWEDGYRQGHFRGHVYEDAVHGLARWREAGLKLYVFSSGSVQAQKLLFAYSDFGDLTPWFSGYFDTNTGAKRESAAYAAIARKIGLPPDAILYLSDIREELDAAREAGLHTTWLVRDQPIDAQAAHRQVANFDAISPN
jgi:enolase-phosphatase E1